MRTRAIMAAGPYRATARADGTVILSPAPGWRLHQGVFARQALADELEAYLNALHKKGGGKKRRESGPA